MENKRFELEMPAGPVLWIRKRQAPVEVAYLRSPAEGDPEVERTLIEVCLGDMESRACTLEASFASFERGVEDLVGLSARVGADGVLSAAMRLQDILGQGELRMLRAAMRRLLDEVQGVKEFLCTQRDELEDRHH